MSIVFLLSIVIIVVVAAKFFTESFSNLLRIFVFIIMFSMIIFFRRVGVHLFQVKDTADDDNIYHISFADKEKMRVIGRVFLDGFVILFTALSIMLCTRSVLRAQRLKKVCNPPGMKLLKTKSFVSPLS